ncbi:hypothetical protein [Pseudoalteromonas obscura]|uniref:hypothetical protein n=1 Tax=Pseudoalteromonas obscura TaxID=3048491 RepID=UPI0024DEC129|nr:hypothetical protein [Pseudoalteromonas sp. P94(2023)]
MSLARKVLSRIIVLAISPKVLISITAARVTAMGGALCTIHGVITSFLCPSQDYIINTSVIKNALIVP